MILFLQFSTSEITITVKLVSSFRKVHFRVQLYRTSAKFSYIVSLALEGWDKFGTMNPFFFENDVFRSDVLSSLPVFCQKLDSAAYIQD